MTYPVDPNRALHLHASVARLHPREIGHLLSSSSTQLVTVWGLGRSDVWVAGSGGMTEHWDGSSWTARPTPSTDTIVGVWGSDPTHGGPQPLVVRFSLGMDPSGRRPPPLATPCWNPCTAARRATYGRPPTTAGSLFSATSTVPHGENPTSESPPQATRACGAQHPVMPGSLTAATGSFVARRREFPTWFDVRSIGIMEVWRPSGGPGPTIRESEVARACTTSRPRRTKKNYPSCTDWMNCTWNLETSATTDAADGHRGHGPSAKHLETST